MIYRFLFMGYPKDGQTVTLKKDIPCYAALSRQNDKVFLYVESNTETVCPENLVCGEMKPYPNGKQWERGIDIFHYSVPMNEEQWRRKFPKEPSVRVNRLKPEKTSSYIYYHYQYQEEYPGDGDKYGVIYLLGDLMVFYMETPEEPETVKTVGLLTSKNSPLDVWQELMTEHFADQWRPIENLEWNDYIAFNT